jgi:hypothetical protein
VKHLFIFAILILTTFISCEDSKLPDTQVEEQAFDVILRLGDKGIDTFRHWSYGARGPAEIWSKLDTSSYGCFYFNTDTVEISVGQIENFEKDFPMSINVDTSLIYWLNFKKLNEYDLAVIGRTHFGHDTLLIGKIEIARLFIKDEPFKRFATLTEFKNQLNIIGSFYRPDIGNFIQLYLTPEYVLTYLPDDLYIDSRCKDIWMRYFSTGKNLTKNWKLIQLDRQLDNG